MNSSFSRVFSRRSFRSTLGASAAALALLSSYSRLAPAEPAKKPALGADYNISLLTDSSPDLTDVDRYLHSITSQYSTQQEQAIAIWRWSQRLRKQMTNPLEGGLYVLDPVRMFNSFGYCNCGIISGVNDALWLRMGWKAHYVQLGDHTVTETSWDDGKTWHMFDSSMSFYCFNDQGAVASVREIEKNPRFYLENYAPECGTNAAHDINDHRAWRCASDHPVEFQRTLANGYDSFKPPNDIEDYNLMAQWGHQYVLNLRPSESYTRYFARHEEAGAPGFRPVNGSKDVDVNKNIRSNGVWKYAPDLRDPATKDFVYSDSGVTWTKDGVKGPGEVVFKVTAANVVTAAKVNAAGERVTFSISRDAGINWEKIALTSGEAQCTAQVAGATEFLMKAQLEGAASGLSSFQVETLTQINRPSLPKLTRGANRIQISMGPQVDTIQFQPSVVIDKYQTSLFAGKGLDADKEVAFYKPILRAGENNTPCDATWKIEAPTPITDITYGGSVCVKMKGDSVKLLHSWDDHEYAKDFEKATDAIPNDEMVLAKVDSAPANTKTAFFRYEFQTQRSAKNYFGPGIQMATMTVHHQPRKAGFAPIEVNYCWIEHRETGDVERQHTELITSPSQEYTINVGGFREPTMKWVRMNLAGFGPDGAAQKVGYSDGQDVGPGTKRPWERYTWGKNLAQEKPYILTGKQDDRNPDGGGDLTDGIIAPPDYYVTAKYMPTYVMFAKDEAPVATVDLGSEQTVSAVRVQAGQDSDCHITFPEHIEVEVSSDGKTFTPVGKVGFNQVFDPPADYVPWELDDSPRFDKLPAGGRLAYGYRILLDQPNKARYVRVKCESRKGWGILLSEIQIFDTVKVEKNAPPAVVLPPLAKR